MTPKEGLAILKKVRANLPKNPDDWPAAYSERGCILQQAARIAGPPRILLIDNCANVLGLRNARRRAWISDRVDKAVGRVVDAYDNRCKKSLNAALARLEAAIEQGLKEGA